MTPASYEAVVAYPEGTSTVARLVATAADAGYGGVVVRDVRELPERPAISAVAERYGLDVVPGVELDPDVPDDASGMLPGLREEHPLVGVAGGTTRINRFVAAQPHVDVLARPITPGGPFFEPGTARTAADNDVAVEIPLGPLRDAGGRRVWYLQRLRALWRVVDHAGVDYVVSARPTSHLAIRGPRQLRALGGVVGVPREAVDRGLARWGTLAERNRTGGESP
ncbi:MAG: RNase P subunit p30 family protein [Halobacteriales archaeon]